MTEEDQDLIQLIYDLARGMQNSGHTDEEIIEALMKDGLDKDSAASVIANLNTASGKS